VKIMPKVGAHAGWHLDFREGDAEQAARVASFGSSDYHASIEAALPGGLDGGSYTFVLEGVTNEDYADLYKAMSKKELIVRLHLYWRDAGIAGYFVDLAGLTDVLQGDEPPKNTLVAVLRVFALKRRAGARRYEVVVNARERVYDRLLGRLAAGGKADDLLDAARFIGDDRNVGVKMAQYGLIETNENEPVSERERSWARGDVALDRLRQLGLAIERRTRKFGLGMYLIRDNELHFGPDRHQIASDHDELAPDNGLIQIDSRGQETSDPNFVPEKETDKEPRRSVFELILRGRPDIKPGDFVEFVLPPEETDAAGTPTSFSLDLLAEVNPGAKVKVYVRGVSHRLGREHGFITTVRGVSVPGPDNDSAWFRHSPPKGPAAIASTTVDDSPEGEFVGVLREVVDRAGGQRIDVAQVRGANVKQGDTLATQTEKLWRGLTGDEGRPYAAATLPFDDTEMRIFEAAPYTAPFAWGKFGLVLPRYPGMRVLVAHRLGDGDDIVEVGALWQRGQAPASKPGDYWLILPAGVAEADRELLPDDKKAKEPAGKATNDLIDADGTRVIEVGKLTVRVGVSSLAEGGTRPTAAAGHVHIEHESGAKIVIDHDGNITIQAAKKLDLIAGDQITLDTPNDVIVKTGGVMDVKGRS
jgi:hypothetical protein